MNDSIPRGLRLVPEAPPEVDPRFLTHVGPDAPEEEQPRHLFVVGSDDWELTEAGIRAIANYLVGNPGVSAHPAKQLHLVVTDNEFGQSIAKSWHEWLPAAGLRIERESTARGWVDPAAAMIWDVVKLGVRHAFVFSRNRDASMSNVISILQTAGVPHTVVRQDEWPL